MSKLCNVDLDHLEETLEKIGDLAERIKRDFHARVYLFGSFATGEIHEGSDIDLVVIGDFSGKMPDRIGEILKMTDLPVAPLCYTREEFARLKRTSSFLKTTLRTARRV